MGVQRTGRRTVAGVVGGVALTALLVVPGQGSAGEAPERRDTPACASSRPPVDDREVHTYDGCRATDRNWERTFADQRISSVVDGRSVVDLTTSTALAGAVASLRVDGKEFIASGGHGAALQYALHDTARGECYNPTEAGTKRDDFRTGWPAPFHGPSTSALLDTGSNGTTVRTTNRMAMYVPEGHTSDWDGCTADFPDRTPYTQGLSPYVLHKTVTVRANVVRFDARVDVEAPEAVAAFDATLIAYLQEDFTAFATVDPATARVTPIPAERFTAERGVGYFSARGPLIASTGDGRYALGIYTAGPRNPRIGETALYTAGRSDGTGTYQFVNRTLQVSYYGRHLTPGTLNYTTYFVVGDRDRVAHDLAALHAAAV